ncbi:MAG: hypothetical protein FWG73_08270 [Planctomycetaceae bacterium]|nr:hypothetical protein [Planctomycetaceae bacterium]
MKKAILCLSVAVLFVCATINTIHAEPVLAPMVPASAEAAAPAVGCPCMTPAAPVVATPCAMRVATPCAWAVPRHCRPVMCHAPVVYHAPVVWRTWRPVVVPSWGWGYYYGYRAYW